MPVKPYDLYYLTSVIRNADLNKIVATAIALGCLGGLVSGKLGQKDLGWLLVGCGIGATVVARSSTEISIDTNNILNDKADTSAQARTNVEFKALQEVPQDIPEYNWELLARTGLPTYILGDRTESLKVAEWLAWKTQGTSVFVSDVPEDIRVSQCIAPGKPSVCTLYELLSYKATTDYSGILEVLNTELQHRRNANRTTEFVDNNLWDLTVILDNPPVAPDIRHCVSLNIHYIVLGKSFEGWQEILVGSEAYQYAQKQSAAPYWKEVLRRWDSGVFPILVNKQLARLPQL